MKRYILFKESYHEFSSPSEGYIKSFQYLSEAIDFSSRLFTVKPWYHQENKRWLSSTKINQDFIISLQSSEISEEFREIIEHLQRNGGVEGFEILDIEDGKVVFNSQMLLENYIKQINQNEVDTNEETNTN